MLGETDIPVGYGGLLRPKWQVFCQGLSSSRVGLRLRQWRQAIGSCFVIACFFLKQSLLSFGSEFECRNNFLAIVLPLENQNNFIRDSFANYVFLC
jgi:hypothetical protein